MKNLLVAVFVAAFFVATPAVAQPVFQVTITVDATNNNGDRDPDTPGLQVDEGDIVTITTRVQWEGMRYPDRSNISTGHVFPGGTASQYSLPYGKDYRLSGAGQIFDRNGRDYALKTFIHIFRDSLAEPDETIIWPMPPVTRWCFSELDEFDRSERIECDGSEFTIVRSDPVTITIRQNDGDVLLNRNGRPAACVAPLVPVTTDRLGRPVACGPPVTPATPDPVADNSTARAENPLNAPTAAIARGIGILAADAVTKRLRTTATANQLNIGRANTAEELLRRSDFNLAGGRGFNFWGGGSYVSTDGEHDGVDYDGDTSAFTLGIDTGWRDGLIGVAVSRSDSDVDMTLTAPVPPIGRIVDIKGKLETEVTSVHPYLTRRFGKSRLWLTAGYGNGNAEVKEQYARIKTDITVTTVALGLRRAHGQLTGNISALYTRAELDDVTDGRTYLLGTTVDSLRITADGKARWVHGAFSPFVDFTVRHDSGDGDTGIAGDLGGGIEYRAPTVVVRLTAAATIAAESAEENRASFTVRKSAGDFDLSLNLGLNNAGIETARLLHGKWRL